MGTALELGGCCLWGSRRRAGKLNQLNFDDLIAKLCTLEIFPCLPLFNWGAKGTLSILFHIAFGPMADDISQSVT